MIVVATRIHLRNRFGSLEIVLFTNLLVLDDNLEIRYSEIFEGHLFAGHSVEILVEGEPVVVRVESVSTPEVRGLYPTAVAYLRLIA